MYEPCKGDGLHYQVKGNTGQCDGIWAHHQSPTESPRGLKSNERLYPGYQDVFLGTENESLFLSGGILATHHVSLQYGSEVVSPFPFNGAVYYLGLFENTPWLDKMPSLLPKSSFPLWLLSLSQGEECFSQETKAQHWKA